ncbi:SDR family NAD(P)-dependent oxidoreductase [Sphingomonas solaris]|uniref:SDR family oxidoreductase n=1 Tax=Alterirhizorhabdus solaris TaxID=2529389 RepID=A0A558R6Q1_9SPHN|nr:SDR family oxidoreductase [Sphingomonas solaris]TVV75066.1 SDR family oxidoreductase [Sphingomonas solaris]
MSINILVTGASRGIGAAILDRLDEASIRLVGHATLGDGDRLIAADFAQADAPAELWQAALDRLDGRIDVLVNNAGIPAPLLEMQHRPAHWHYAASKAGMVAMTKTIARAYAAEGILAFAVCPGFTMTGMAEDYLASRGGDRLLADIPLGRVAKPAEVAETVRFLALSAPPSMTGAILDINGASYVR